MKSTNYLASFVIILLFIAACSKVQVLPDIPHITYTGFRIYDTTDLLGNIVKGGTLTFHFEDGDGDVGLQQPSDSQTDSINLFLDLFRIKNGKVNAAPADDPLKPTGFRIPYMDRPGQNKILKGTIEVDFTYLFYETDDTIKYDFYIKDRAGHVSNVDSTSYIPIAIDGDYKNR
jgi:hypothetical protein